MIFFVSLPPPLLTLSGGRFRLILIVPPFGKGSKPEMDTHTDPLHTLRKQLAVRTGTGVIFS